MALGRAATEQAGGVGARVLVIRDTRQSGEMLEAALAAGITAAGGEALLGGVLPTPAAPLLIKQRRLHRAFFKLVKVLARVLNAKIKDLLIGWQGHHKRKADQQLEKALEIELHTPDSPLRRAVVDNFHEAGEKGHAEVVHGHQSWADEIETADEFGVFVEIEELRGGDAIASVLPTRERVVHGP